MRICIEMCEEVRTSSAIDQQVICLESLAFLAAIYGYRYQ